MYATDEEIDRTSLRQGDIIAGVQHIGAITLSAINLVTPATGGGAAVAWTVQAPPTFGSVMVVSHSCEIALENKVKVTSVILAPVRDVSSATSLEMLDTLIASNLIDQTSPGASFLKYFYLEPAGELEFERGAVADFSKCFSVRKKSYDFLVERKILQLRADIRESMSLKLALYFHRQQGRTAA